MTLIFFLNLPKNYNLRASHVCHSGQFQCQNHGNMLPEHESYVWKNESTEFLQKGNTI